MSSNNTACEIFSWDDLLACVSERRVVPVIGRDVLVTEVDGRKVLLYPYLASLLAERLKVKLADAAEPKLEEVAFQYLLSGGQRSKIYQNLMAILKDLTIPTPDPLRKLAEIDDFNLFVSTTFDRFLVKALDEIRFGGRQETRTLSYNLKHQEDLREGDLKRLDGPLVYHLFGKATSVPEYAVTDEDIIEFLHKLQSDTRTPHRLFDVLQDNHVLVLGCRISNWLARIFIRTVKSERFLNCGTADLIADDHVRQDSDLVVFLRHYSTEVYDNGGPVHFIDELHRRWRNSKSRAEPSRSNVLQPCAIPKGLIFISYAREDQEAARNLRESLIDSGVEAWLDESEIPPASDWDSIIQDNIRRCSIFIPCLSRQIERRREGYFWSEWKSAIEREKKMAPNARFIWPVIVDNLQKDAESILNGLRRLQMTRLPGGRATSEFLDEMKLEIRRIRSASYR